MKVIRTETIIPATAGKIWDILVNAEGYAEWNPQIIRMKGRLVSGEKIHVRAHAPIGPNLPMGFKAKIVHFEPGKKLAWEGGVPGILNGHHFWELEQLGEQTKMIHGERFEGPFEFLLTDKRLRDMSKAYEAANLELKKFIEKAGH